MVTNFSKGLPAKSEERIALSRAEICLLILLVVAGLGTWVWVDRKMNVLLKDREPRETLIKAKFHVAPQQAEVLMAEKERKAIEAQLIIARLEQEDAVREARKALARTDRDWSACALFANTSVLKNFSLPGMAS